MCGAAWRLIELFRARDPSGEPPPMSAFSQLRSSAGARFPLLPHSLPGDRRTRPAGARFSRTLHARPESSEGARAVRHPHHSWHTGCPHRPPCHRRSPLFARCMLLPQLLHQQKEETGRAAAPSFYIVPSLPALVCLMASSAPPPSADLLPSRPPPGTNATHQ